MNTTNIVTRQPVLTGGITVGSVNLILVLILEALASYGVVITPQLQALVFGLVGFVFPIAAAFITRRYTTWWSADNPLVKYPQDPTGR